MIGPTSISGPHTARRAETIYLQARGAIDARLWRAALGSDATTGAPVIPQNKAGLALESLLAAAAAAPAPVPQSVARPVRQAVLAPTQQPVSAPSVKNRAPHTDVPISYRQYQSNIKAAAARTNIPSAALAAIVDAEAGNDKAGRWRTDSRNARSTATGLGQFLADLAVGGRARRDMAQRRRAGTRLAWRQWQGVATGAGGAARPQARCRCFDQCHSGLGAAKSRQPEQGRDRRRRQRREDRRGGLYRPQPRTRRRRPFFTGGLDDRRARVLLDAQVGSGRASSRVVAAGSAVAAHRTWLIEFVSKQVRSDRFVD